MAAGPGVRVTISVHHEQIAAYLRNPSSPPTQFVERACQLAENLAKANCPVDEGRLRSSIGHEVRVEGKRVVGSIGSPLHYARFVHEGTGIYGPRRAWIYPKRGGFLVFEAKGPLGPLRKGKRRPAKGKRDVVFARRVRGTPPTRFLTAGLEGALPGVPIRYHA